MAGFFDNSSTRPRTVAWLILVVGLVFLLGGGPLVAYGISLPSTMENEMLPFILLLCGVLLCGIGMGLVILGVKVRRRYPSA
jgi:uncharacterized membrane protein